MRQVHPVTQTNTVADLDQQFKVFHKSLVVLLFLDASLSESSDLFQVRSKLNLQKQTTVFGFPLSRCVLHMQYQPTRRTLRLTLLYQCGLVKEGFMSTRITKSRFIWKCTVSHRKIQRLTHIPLVQCSAAFNSGRLASASVMTTHTNCLQHGFLTGHTLLGRSKIHRTSAVQQRKAVKSGRDAASVRCQVASTGAVWAQPIMHCLAWVSKCTACRPVNPFLDQ